MTTGAKRHTHDGRPGITAEFFRRRQSVRQGSALGPLTDPDTLADALLAELGPAKANATAWALLALVRDHAAA